MDDALGRGLYEGPRVLDYGDLLALTSANHLLYGSHADTQVRELSFSGTGTDTGTGGQTTAAGSTVPTTMTGAGTDPTPTNATPTTQTVAGTTTGGGTTPAATTGGGGSSGVGPGGDSLPFTGYPAATVAAIGSALVTAGATLRRAVRVRRQP
jgi:hypothetical protein